ncbi:hypothetical protein QYM36_009980, partial [Artemia franciscana]
TPPASTFRRIDLSPNMSGTLPRTSLSPTSSRDGSRLQTPKRGVVFAETERDDGNDRAPGELSPLSPDSLTTPNLSPNGSVGKNKGIKKLFGRMRRSNSSAFDEPENNFKRGGVRATAGPRLGWVPDNRPTFIEPSTTFSNWDTETIVNWLNNLGLLAAAMEARRWVKKGQQMIDASPSELEKELALKNPLHKKKLLLALEAKGRPINETLRPFGTPAISPSLEEAFATLDHNWVVRWLDDVGLPQYKDLFMESRVDARMLHNLTIEDLCSYLKVSNLLHMTSIKRGIQCGELGVHGALMAYEPKFTAELLATILSIPVGKTLLRRHLTTHFKELVGKDVMLEKRDVENESGYTPLTPLVKAKIAKRGQFTLKRRKSKSEFDPDELVCPIDSTSKNTSVSSPSL